LSCEKSGGGHEQLNPLHRIRLEHLLDASRQSSRG
jgi:hypothetical protein